MQVAGLLSSLVRENAVPTDTSSVPAGGDFGAALTESMLGTAPAGAGKQVSGKKITGKSDSKISSGSDPDEQLSAVQATANPAPLAQLAVVPLPPADATIAVPKAERAVTAVGENLGSETGLLGSAPEASDGVVTPGTDTATARTTVPRPLGSTPLVLDDFRSASSQVGLMSAGEENHPAESLLTENASTKTPPSAVAPVLASSALPRADFKFALAQVVPTTVSKSATIPPTATSLSLAAPAPSSTLIAPPSGAQAKFVSSEPPSASTGLTISTETPTNPLPPSQIVSSQNPRLNLKSLTVDSLVGPPPPAADPVDTSSAVSTVTGETEFKVVRVTTADASRRINPVPVPVTTKAVAQTSTALEESNSPTDAIPRLAGQAAVKQTSSPILQRRAVDVYNVTSGVVAETNPRAAKKIDSNPAAQLGLTPSTNEVTAPDVPSQFLATSARTPNLFPSSIVGTVASPAEMKSVRSSVVQDVFVPAGMSMVQQKQSESSSPTVDLRKPDSTLPTPLTPATATATDTSTGIPAPVRSPIASAPEAAGPSSQPAQDPLAGTNRARSTMGKQDISGNTGQDEIRDSGAERKRPPSGHESRGPSPGATGSRESRRQQDAPNCRV